MTRTEKILAKHKMHKQVEEVLRSPEYREMQREIEAKNVSIAIGKLAFIGCEFLENNHGYKKTGLKKFLKYLLDCLEYTSEDEEFFLTHDKYYKEMMDLDVLAELRMALENEHET